MGFFFSFFSISFSFLLFSFLLLDLWFLIFSFLVFCAILPIEFSVFLFCLIVLLLFLILFLVCPILLREFSAKLILGPAGLKDIFSIYSMGEQIDLNSAALPVLRVGLGIPQEVARLIIKAREENGFENQQDLIQRVPAIAPFMGEISRFHLFRAGIPYYTIEVKAKTKEEGAAVRGLKVIVKIDPQEKGGRKMIQWLDVFN